MRFPHASANTHKIGMFVHTKGSATKAEVFERFSHIAQRKVADTINHMISEGMLNYSDGALTVKRYLATHFDHIAPTARAVGEIVQPRTVPEFRPLQPKNMFWLAPRREQIREVSFLSGSGVYQPLFGA